MFGYNSFKPSLYLFASRGWRINIYPIPKSTRTCTAW